MIAPKGEVQTTPRLSLFQIEAELLGLLDQREDAEQRHSDAKEMPVILAIEEELKAIEGLIRDYVKAEVRKVDSCAFAIKEYEARAAARSQEAERMKASSDRDAETAKRIKAVVLEVMQEFNEKKFSGRLFTISRQGNGGVQALTIAQPDLVPDHLRTVTVRIRGNDFKAIPRDTARSMEIVSDEPNNGAIRAILERAEVERKAIMEEAEILAKGASEAALYSQKDYIGKKLARLSGVPGTRLEPRGEHVKIK
jgi:Siphovirus Gp157